MRVFDNRTLWLIQVVTMTGVIRTAARRTLIRFTITTAFLAGAWAAEPVTTVTYMQTQEKPPANSDRVNGGLSTEGL